MSRRKKLDVGDSGVQWREGLWRFPLLLNTPISLQTWLPSCKTIHFIKGSTQKRGLRNGNYSRAFKSLCKPSPTSPSVIYPLLLATISGHLIWPRGQEKLLRRESRGKADSCSDWNKNQIQCCAFQFQVTGLLQDSGFYLIPKMVF